MIAGSVIVFLLGMLMFGSPMLAICVAVWCVLEYTIERP